MAITTDGMRQNIYFTPRIPFLLLLARIDVDFKVSIEQRKGVVSRKSVGVEVEMTI